MSEATHPVDGLPAPAGAKTVLLTIEDIRILSKCDWFADLAAWDAGDWSPAMLQLVGTYLRAKSDEAIAGIPAAEVYMQRSREAIARAQEASRAMLKKIGVDVPPEPPEPEKN